LREQADNALATPEFTWNDVHEMVDRARWLIRNRIKALPEAVSQAARPARVIARNQFHSAREAAWRR
jgi:hypothetical protein